ncbi:MAG: geranylgeranylglycerol-phosphate geranylgeranyltransferase [Flavobacteriales bacterium]|nr:geranylgeranylglycerol-phosphate geranylgeranyltransferase [Flavobacteriales bacterium]
MAYLRLARWPNLLMIGLIFLLAKTQLIDPVSELSGVISCISNLHWLLLALATMLIAASGNVVNDIFDQNIDFHNKPERIIVGNTISEAKAWNYYYGLGSVGLGLGMFLCWDLGNLSNSLIFMLSAGGLYFYSYSYKRQFLIGNLVVAFLAGLVPFLPLYFQMMCTPNMWMELPWAPVLVALGFFSFLTTLIREMIKDMEDLKGDQLLKCTTIPIVLGVKGAKAIVILLLMFLMSAIVSLQTAWIHDKDWLMFSYFLIVVQLPAASTIFLVMRGKTPKDFHLASTLTKVLMLGGILSIVVFRIAVL